MDYPLQLTSQLQQLLKSLRKSRQLTQAQLARRLGVVQSRVADIERDPGTVSVEQLMNVLAMLGAQLVVRETTSLTPVRPSADSPDGPALEQPARPDSVVSQPPQADSLTSEPPALPSEPSSSPPSPPSTPSHPDEAPGEEPRGQW